MNKIKGLNNINIVDYLGLATARPGPSTGSCGKIIQPHMLFNIPKHRDWEAIAISGNNFKQIAKIESAADSQNSLPNAFGIGSGRAEDNVNKLIHEFIK